MSYIGRQPTVGNFQICDAISVVNGQAAYTMQVGSVNVTPQSANHMIVSLNGTIQKPNSSYTVANSVITFSSNLATGDVIDFIQILGDVLDLGVPSDATVTTAKIVDGAITSAKLASGVGGVAGITSSADATAITIDSDEKVLINKTSAGSANVGAEFSSSGSSMTRSGGTPLIINRTTNFGELIKFRKDNSDVGKIDCTSAGIGIYLGGTAAANHLDDYEEGSFTPAYSFDSGSVTMQGGGNTRGHYVKVGNLVHFQIYMATTGISSPSGDAIITGLPITTGNQSSSSAAIGLAYRYNTNMTLKARISQGGTTIQLWKNTTGSSNSTAVQGSDFQSGNAYNNLHVAGCYSTA